MSSLNSEIKAAIDESDIARARQLLRDALPEANAETYYLGSLVAVDDEQRREFLEKAVALDPFHEEARKALKVLKNGSAAETAPAPVPLQPVAAPAQPPQTTEQPLVLPLAKVQGDGIVYTIPHSRGTVRTTLPTGVTVEVLERDAKSTWINMTFVNSVGQRAFGWIPLGSLGEITFKGQPASVDDLRISEMEFSSKSEIEELIQRVTVSQLPLIFGLVLVIIAIISLFGFLIFNGRYPLSLLASGFTLLGGLGLIYLSRRLQWLQSVPMCAFNDVQLRTLRKSKMSTTELVLEQQQQALLLSIAGNMATRLVPNNINVKHR